MSLETILIVVLVLFLPGGGRAGDGVTSTSVRLVAFGRHDFLKVKQTRLIQVRANGRPLMKDGSIAVFVGNWAVEKGPPPRLRRV
jgi:hypothetical protein